MKYLHMGIAFCIRLLLTLVSLMVFSCTLVQAQTEKYIQTLTGKIVKGDSCVVTDDKFTDPVKWSHITENRTVDNLVTFELRYDTMAYFFDRTFTCTLQLDIEYEDASHSKQQLKNISLQVGYDTARGRVHQGICWYRFKGGHHVKLIISKITSPEWGNKIPPVFRIKNEIVIERLYTLNTIDPIQHVTAADNSTVTSKGRSSSGANMIAGSAARADGAGQQQTISWDAGEPGFPQYDFEWTFYDDSSLVGLAINNKLLALSPQSLEFLFKNNSSRVTVSLPLYQLNLVYNRGWVLHRVRGVRYDESTGERLETAWSYAGNYVYGGNAYGLIRCNGHEGFLNWQYNCAFAEEGKRKELVNYFDGSLRNRQSVTLNHDNSGSKTIVQENVFDAMGRPAVNILPSPTEASSLQYFNNFNRSAVSNAPYQFSDFETPGNCYQQPSAMSNTSGAAQYYSPFNPQKDNAEQFYFAKYIPDARGYPFAITGFTPDNTGRVKSQGGVGPLFQPGKTAEEDNHITRYFYGKPLQAELDRLFGNEVGNAAHYLKNMVIDANGQASVSYINSAGKTIATALAGKAPASLQPLSSYQYNSTPFITNLADEDNIIRDPEHLTITSNETLLAPAAGNITLQYEFTPLSLQVLYGIENNKICADCYYDLSINVTDNCGNTIQSLKHEAVYSEKTSCEPAPASQHGNLQFHVAQPGEYNISYQLSLSRKAIDFYVSQYLLQDVSLQKEIDFQRNYLHRLDLSACFNDCETCVAKLGTEDGFISRFTGVLQRQYHITASDNDISWYKRMYKQLIDECRLLQEGCGQTANPCEEQTVQLKEDVTLGGQYMLFDPTTNRFTERDINVWLKNKEALTNPVTINGVTKSFNKFSETEVIEHWNDAWTDILLPYHPENINNCFVTDCSSNAENERYDNAFLNTTEAAVAAGKHYWFDDDYLSVVSNDPYFKQQGAGQKNEFLENLANYSGTGLDIMAFVRWSVYCNQKSQKGNYPGQIVACPRTPFCNRTNDEWQLFKTLYYIAKNAIRNKYTTCNSSSIFPDAAGSIAMPATANAVANCAATGLFEISNAGGTVSIQYTGVQPITKDITLQYFAVDSNGVIAASAFGNTVFNTGTVSGTKKTVPGLPGLFYVIDFARCDPAHPYYSKIRRNYNGLQLAVAAATLENKSPAQLDADALAIMINECNESCVQNADAWMQKLAGCNLDIESTEYHQIREGLIAVCEASCSVSVQDHPFGASSTIAPTINGDKNFRDVLMRILGVNRFSALCNDLLLDYPAALSVKPLYANEIVRTLSPCAYNLIKAWKAAYQLSTGYVNFTDYIKATIDPQFSLTDADINNLVAATDNNCFTAQPLILPASLSCSAGIPATCLTCTALLDEKINFATDYAYVEIDDPAYYELLAKYINQKNAFNISSVDFYNSLQNCSTARNGFANDSIGCDAFAAAYHHFEVLQPGYFTNLNGNPGADSIFQLNMTLWLNTELHRELSFDYYRNKAASCNVPIVHPYSQPVLRCDSSKVLVNSLPQFITCCDSFDELEKFRQVFPDSIDARVLAVYFMLLRTQWSSPVNLPSIDYRLSYDSLVRYFSTYKLPGSFTVTVRPDSLISYSAVNTGSCNATALNFKKYNDVNSSAELYAICNKPLQPLLAVEEDDCVSQQINTAIGNAHSDYLEYLEKVKRDYRNAYYNKCLSITPKLSMTALYDQPLEYHYTLYYYDQSGNLIKTIPPAGVQLVDEAAEGTARMGRIANFRKSDKDYCYTYGDTPAMNGTASITVADNTAIQQQSSPFTIEAFINFNTLGGEQLIVSKRSVNPADGRMDGYKIYLKNNRLVMEIAGHGTELWTQTLSKIVPYAWPSPYNAQPPLPVRVKEVMPVQRGIYRNMSAEITSDIGGLVITGQWIHLAAAYTGDRLNPLRLYINGSLVNSRLIIDSTDYTPADAPSLSQEAIAAGTTMLSFEYRATIIPLTLNNIAAANLVIGASSNGLIGSIKQLRLYKRLLPTGEIQSNAFNSCLVPQSEGQLVLWLPLNKEETQGASVDRVSQLSTVNNNTVFSSIYQPVYPAHKMPTHYYYNSLNSVTRRLSPDGGNNQYYYDLQGRLLVSQNAEQKTSSRGEANNRYSYTKYDLQGRVIETGEKIGAIAMTNAIAKTDPSLPGSPISNWMLSGSNVQVTQTTYDRSDLNVVTNRAITDSQQVYNTSRKRVVATIYRNSVTTNIDYNSATHYQYDINGNIKRLWQEQKKSATGTSINLLKDLQYQYDLLSGKVNAVIYQRGKGDQFVYKYEYDPENRLLAAYSGRDMLTLQQDVGYRYYLHGPVARMELGDGLSNRIVQGCDYAYTLQGWLKGVNGVALGTGGKGLTDMGMDGSVLKEQGLHAQVARDVFALSLGYHQDDYAPLGGATAKAFSMTYNHPSIKGGNTNGSALFNGNISNATCSIAGIDNAVTQGYSYGYDQLGRLFRMRAHDLSLASAGNGWSNSSVIEAHREDFTYDANGNITTLNRNGSQAAGRPIAMDALQYKYFYYSAANIRNTYTPGQPLPADAWAITNQLAHVKDVVPAANYPAAADPQENDIDSQADNNYTYDGIGNLVRDSAEGITAIGWTLYGKIRNIVKKGGTSIVYDYDGVGNRIQKLVIFRNIKTITNYIHDAQGNTIAVYTWRGRVNETPVVHGLGNGWSGQTWEEQYLYGSNRLGMWKPGLQVPDTLNLLTGSVQVGTKFFELSNHLGNVLAVISDKKLALPAADNPALMDHYEPELISATDYSAFGATMPARHFNLSTTAYRYGFNGKENDNEVKGQGNQQDYGMRIYDPRLARFLSVDPITANYPMLSPYQFGSNGPISGIDKDGMEYSPAGKVGIFAVDATAVQLYYDHPSKIQQQKANAPMVHLAYEVARANNQPAYLATQWQPRNEFERQRHQALKEDWYDRDGYNADGSARPATRLANDKTWNNFADKIALPGLDVLSLGDGVGEARAFLKAITFLEKKEFQTLAKTGMINPKTIRFSQDNIAANFKSGESVNLLIERLKNGEKIDIEPIRIVEYEGLVYTLDNRRLFAYRKANVPIPYQKLDKIPTNEMRKFSTLNNGRVIEVRKNHKTK